MESGRHSQFLVSVIFLNCLYRLSYVVWLLEELVHSIPSDIDVYVMYDIACTLAQHLKASKNGDHLLERFKFVLPSFNAFGHNAACQVVRRQAS